MLWVIKAVAIRFIIAQKFRDHMDELLTQDVAKISTEELNKHLVFIYRNYNMYKDKQQVHAFLFRLFGIAGIHEQYRIYKLLKYMKKDIQSVHFDIVKLLGSLDIRVKRLALSIIRTFWSFYEFDEVIVYRIKNYKMFSELLARNPKYKAVFKIQMEAHAPVKNTKEGGGQQSMSTKDTKSAAIQKMKQASTDGDLRVALEDLLNIVGPAKQKICRYFLEKLALEQSDEKDDIKIPGINHKEGIRVIEDGVDSAFELELLGLKNIKFYQHLQQVYEAIIC